MSQLELWPLSGALDRAVPRAGLVLGAGLALIAAAGVIGGRLADLWLVTAGGALAMTALVAFAAKRHRVRRQRRCARIAEAFIERDPTPTLLADGAGRIRTKNPAAEARMRRGAMDLPAALSQMLADPAPVVDRLQAQALDTGRAEEWAGTGRQRLSISVRRTGAGLFLWQIADRAEEAEAQGVPQVIPTKQGREAMGLGWEAVEDLPVPMLKINPEGRVLGINRQARSLLRADEPLGAKLSELMDGLGRPIADWVAEAISGRGGNDPQFLHVGGRKGDRYVQVTLNPAGTGSGRHLIAVLNDVTEFKSLEAQFVQSQKMQAIGQLAGGVAHDFNNLLTAISGHCDLLLLRHGPDDPEFGDLDQIHQNANRAAALVRQLLAFSRKQNLQLQHLDLRETLADLTHLLNRLVGEKITLTLAHDPDLHAIRADKRQLEQVIMNLVVNARDAMPKGGEIRIVTENVTLDAPMERDRAKVVPGSYVVVRVSDCGGGIPPEVLPKIFEPFYTTKRAGEGTGLGLSTAYGIVKQTGGFIFVDSTPGEGTVFTLYFPAHEMAETDATAPRPSVAPPDKDDAARHQDGIVLLVEDEAPVRAFAGRALRMRGYAVLEADSGEAALDILSDPDQSVDLFVTDVIMTGKDGPTWVREALTARPGTPVVFVSGYAEDAFADQQAEIPNSVFLAKPFSLADLTATVQRQLR